MKIILIIILICVAGAGFLWACEKGFEKIERNECAQWQEDSGIYPMWYSTDWQKEQCLAYGIELK